VEHDSDSLRNISMLYRATTAVKLCSTTQSLSGNRFPVEPGIDLLTVQMPCALAANEASVEFDIPDTLWARVAFLFPRHSPSARGGRPRAEDRRCLSGI
jgi:hypothetical protein